MNIKTISVYQVDLPLVEGRYAWAKDKFVETFDSTIVEIETQTGLYGLGEVCPLGPFYLPAFGAGARAGIGELAKHLIDQPATQIGHIQRVMDQALFGHPYVKSAIDMACWDLLGKETGKPLWALLGGKFGQAVSLYRAISQGSEKDMVTSVARYRAQGYRKFQLKVGGDPVDDVGRIRSIAPLLHDDEILVADANMGWSTADAIRIANMVSDLDVFIEQPCSSYDQCRSVRERISLPLVLDESIDGLEMLLRAYNDRAMDVVNLKISKVGGISKARQMRDLCISLGIPMTIEDSWGGDIVTAAIAHLAHSTPEPLRFSSTDFNSYVTISNAHGGPKREHGTMQASDLPGLGVELERGAVSDPIAVYGT